MENIRVRDSVLLGTDNSTGMDIYYYEFDVAGTANMPERIYNGSIVVMGSIARDITTGSFFSIDSSGTWYNQDGSGALT